MNKNDLIAAVTTTSGLSRHDTVKAVDGVLHSITAALKQGKEVRLVGFGTFSLVRRAAFTGRNPRTGTPMMIKASARPKFKPGKSLIDAVR